MGRTSLDWHKLNEFRICAERSGDPEALRRVARLFREAGRLFGAEALERRAQAAASWMCERCGSGLIRTPDGRCCPYCDA